VGRGRSNTRRKRKISLAQRSKPFTPDTRNTSTHTSALPARPPPAGIREVVVVKGGGGGMLVGGGGRGGALVGGRRGGVARDTRGGRMIVVVGGGGGGALGGGGGGGVARDTREWGGVVVSVLCVCVVVCEWSALRVRGVDSTRRRCSGTMMVVVCACPWEESQPPPRPRQQARPAAGCSSLASGQAR
jgi:hypothetical protein